MRRPPLVSTIPSKFFLLIEQTHLGTSGMSLLDFEPMLVSCQSRFCYVGKESRT